MFEQKLARALKFTEEDLIANRDGYMTKAQRIRLRQRTMRNNIYPPLVAVGVLIVGGIVAVSSGRPIDNRDTTFLLIALMIGGLVGYAYFQWHRLRVDLLKGDVVMQEGRIGLRVGTRGANSLMIRKMTFPINAETLLAFHNDANYRIYFMPHSKRILSAEPIS
jgi:hypothetical protein